MELSLYLTSGNDVPRLFEAARRAEEGGISALWLPERHFGGAGLFPNPAVTAAAMAVATRRIALRAAGLPLALHSPIRVAEEWALVDNLSQGRVGIAFAGVGETSALFQEAEEDDGLDTVRRLWRGEPVRVPDGEGRPVEIRILPRPVQRELPLWHSDPRTAAGLGAHLFLEEPDGDAVAAYREAGGRGRVTVALSAGEDLGRLELLAIDEAALRVDLEGALETILHLEGRRGG